MLVSFIISDLAPESVRCVNLCIMEDGNDKSHHIPTFATEKVFFIGCLEHNIFCSRRIM